MGRFAIGIIALGKLTVSEVKVSREMPGPQRMKAWKPR
jgi:hypothetical protein